jgi:alkylation response protein AidB-like acyl-CoA dehydrogenase
MDLTFSPEQILLRDSAQRYLADHYPPVARPRIATGEPRNRAQWREFAKLGWLGLPLPEDCGGLGQGMVEVGILMQAFGRSLVTEPYVPTVVLCAGLIAQAGSQPQSHAVLPAVAAGESLIALAHVENRARFTLTHVETTARPDAGAWILDGRKTAVLGGADADHFLVSARLSGATRDRSGIGVFLLRRRTDGLSIEPYATLDGVGAAVVGLDRVATPADSLLGGSHDAAAILEASVDRAICASCAELVGIMDAVLDATVAYTKTRIQFGQPLAANQVVRHRLVDMSVACEEARSMALRAALIADGADVAASALAASAAKVKVARAAELVAEQAVQLHGGMGVTDELNIGAYLKRVVSLGAQFGSAEHHLRRHALLSGRGRTAA